MEENNQTSYFSNIEFCSGLFGYMKKIGINEFYINTLEKYIYHKLEDDSVRTLFLDVDKNNVIQEGISNFEIMGSIRRDIYSSNVKAKFLFPLCEALNLIDSIPSEYKESIERIAVDFSCYKNEKDYKIKVYK